jgi:SAM-dependent methyltransferase
VFVQADARALPYPDMSFDVVTCCGSTLSLVPEPDRALQEIGRVLRPGGRALIECEHKWNLDLGWILLGALAGDRLRYGVDPRTIATALGRPWRDGLDLEYPLPVAAGVAVRVRLHLFTRAELDGMLARAGLVPLRRWGIHATTNLIPSTVLHRERLGRVTGGVYRALRRVDRALSRLGLSARFANSLVVLAVKERRRSPAPP